MVKPPALYRSLVFWLGSFVLLFLVWVWADSMKTGTRFVQRVMFQKGLAVMAGYEDGVLLDGGVVDFARTSVRKVNPPIMLNRTPYRIARFPSRVHGGWFPKPRAWMIEDVIAPLGDANRQRVDVPVWILVGIYLLLWIGVMVLRRRRWWRLAGDSAVMNSAASSS